MGLKHIQIIVGLMLLCSSNVFGQMYDQNNPQRVGRQTSVVPQTNTERDPKDVEAEFQEKLENHIQNFINTLEVDAFQKHIIKQKLDSYYVAKLALLNSGLESRIEFEEKVEVLDNTHFNDLNELTPKNIQDSIQKFIKIEEMEPANQKKKKNKKKKTN